MQVNRTAAHLKTLASQPAPAGFKGAPPLPMMRTAQVPNAGATPLDVVGPSAPVDPT